MELTDFQATVGVLLSVIGGVGAIYLKTNRVGLSNDHAHDSIFQFLADLMHRQTELIDKVAELEDKLDAHDERAQEAAGRIVEHLDRE